MWLDVNVMLSLGCPLSDRAWLKASLPCSLGVLSIKSASLHDHAAVLGSLDFTCTEPGCQHPGTGLRSVYSSLLHPPCPGPCC